VASNAVGPKSAENEEGKSVAAASCAPTFIFRRINLSPNKQQTSYRKKSLFRCDATIGVRCSCITIDSLLRIFFAAKADRASLTSMDAMPNEILVHTLRFVDNDRSRAAAAQVCRRFRAASAVAFDPTPAYRWACERNYAEIAARLLMDPRVDPSECQNWALVHFSKMGDLETVQRLLADPRVGPCSKAIRASSMTGHIDVVRLLMADAHNIRFGPLGVHSLNMLIVDGHAAVLQVLLEDDRDRLVLDDDRLRRSSEDGHVDVVRLLLAYGRADPSAAKSRTIRGSSQHGHTEVVKLLLADGRADPASCDNEAIRVSKENGHADVVRLLEADPRVDSSAMPLPRRTSRLGHERTNGNFIFEGEHAVRITPELRQFVIDIASRTAPR
jgi:hypothetical protein